MTFKTGIVMKTDNNKAYIMTKKGEFFKVKFSKIAPLLGQEYTGELIVNKLNYINNFKYIASAAAILFVILLGGGVYAYNTPVSTVTLSTSPEVELKTNIFNRVISVSTQDSDGAKLIENLKLKNTSVEDAVLKIIDKAKMTKNMSIDIDGKQVDTSNIKNEKSSLSDKSSEIKNNENIKENNSSGNKIESQVKKEILPKTKNKEN